MTNGPEKKCYASQDFADIDNIDSNKGSIKHGESIVSLLESMLY